MQHHELLRYWPGQSERVLQAPWRRQLLLSCWYSALGAGIRGVVSHPGEAPGIRATPGLRGAPGCWGRRRCTPLALAVARRSGVLQASLVMHGTATARDCFAARQGVPGGLWLQDTMQTVISSKSPDAAEMRRYQEAFIISTEVTTSLTPVQGSCVAGQ